MAFNSQIGTLYVDLQARGLAGVQSAINSIKSTMGTLAISGARGAGMGGFGGGFGVGSMLAGGGAFGAAGLAAGGVFKASADLDAARRNLRSVFEGSGEDFAKLTKGIDELATKTPVAVTSLYDIAAAAAQAGQEGPKNILEFSTEVAKLASISNMAAESVAESLTRTQNVFKGASTSVLSNVITAVSNKSAASPGTLVTTMGRISGAAKEAGFSIEQTIALAGSLRDIAGGPEVASTSFSKILSSMVESPEAFAKITKMSTAAFEEVRKKNPAEALRLSFAEIAKMDDKGQLAALSSIGLEGTRGKNPALQFVSALDRYVKLLGVANDETGKLTATNERFATIAGGTWKQLEVLKNNIVLAADAVGAAYLPEINLAVEAMTRWIQANKEAIASDTRGWIDAVTEGVRILITLLDQAADGLGKITGNVPENVRKGWENILGRPTGDFAKTIGKADPLLGQFERAAGALDENGPVTAQQAKELATLAGKLSAVYEVAIKEIKEDLKSPALVAGEEKKLRELLKQFEERQAKFVKTRDAMENVAKGGGVGPKQFGGGDDIKFLAEGAGKAAEGLRKFADELANMKLGDLKLADPKGFDALKMGLLAGMPPGMFGANADNFKKFADAFAVAKPGELNPEQIQGIVARRGQGALHFAEQLAEERLQKRREMREPQFLGPDENMRRLQKAALTPDRGLIEIAKEQKEKLEEIHKAELEVKKAIEDGTLKIAENGVVLFGGP